MTSYATAQVQLRRWVVLRYDEGKAVIRPEHVIDVHTIDALGIVAVHTTQRIYDTRPEPGESLADALARVCGLLGIEVTR